MFVFIIIVCSFNYLFFNVCLLLKQQLRKTKQREVQEKIEEEETKRRKEQLAFEEELRKIQELKANVYAQIDELQAQTAELKEKINTIRTQQDKDRDTHASMIARAQQAVNSMAEQVELYKNEVTAVLDHADDEL